MNYKSQLEKNLEALPEMCATIIPSVNLGLPIIIKRGESGFFPAKLIRTQEQVDQFNENLGVTKAQVMAMEAGSCFGWHVPGAHPSEYEMAS